MAKQPDEYEIPSDWSNKDIIEWINATLAEPDVDHLELRLRGSKLVARVVFKQ